MRPVSYTHLDVYKRQVENNMQKEYNLYSLVERLAPIIIGQEHKTYKGVSANIDFYSGFVYHMLGLPLELFTPVFAMSRIVGWSAHLLEEQINAVSYTHLRQAQVHCNAISGKGKCNLVPMRILSAYFQLRKSNRNLPVAFTFSFKSFPIIT